MAMKMCYPSVTDWSCVGSTEEIAELDPTIKARSEMLAWNMLARLTGFRLSLCPVVLRPCARKCNPNIWLTAPAASGGGGGFSPFIRDGVWYNACGCGGDDCGCTVIQELILPDGEVGGPIVVKIDGAVLDPSAYRIDNGNRLVRQDGQGWPACQDHNLPDGEVGTFSISYYVGVGPDPLLAFAAGLLAVEWYKSCSGKDCRLPSTVTSVTRQGVTFEMPEISGMSSGIREVDEIVSIYNPHHLKSRSRILSPESVKGRKRTY